MHLASVLWCERMLKNMQFCSLFEQVFLSVSAALWSLVVHDHEESNWWRSFSSCTGWVHRFVSPILPSSVSRMAWSGLNCSQLTMTFQQVGLSGPITEQMPGFYNEAVADGSNEEVVMCPPSGWCGRSPMAGYYQLLSTLHFQCCWRTLLCFGESLKYYLLLLPASVLKAEFPLILALSLFPVRSLVVTDWPCCHLIRNGFLIFLVSF